jgi:hypothetical protein
MPALSYPLYLVFFKRHSAAFFILLQINQQRACHAE